LGGGKARLLFKGLVQKKDTEEKPAMNSMMGERKLRGRSWPNLAQQVIGLRGRSGREAKREEETRGGVLNLLIGGKRTHSITEGENRKRKSNLIQDMPRF